MAKKVHAELYGINGNKYTVEIHDRSISATSIDANMSDVEINYKGQGAPIYENFLMSSSATFSLKIDSQALLDIVWDIVNKNENYYYLLIKRNDNLYWIGTIVADQITIPRGDYQGVVETTIKANDRLTILENLPFDFGTFSLPHNRERGLEIIKQILQYDCDHFLDHWSATDRYLLDSIESKEATQADGVLFNTNYKQESFVANYDPEPYVNGDAEYISCAQAIEQILAPHGAQIMMNFGSYVIKQVQNHFTASTEFHQYTKTLSKKAGFYTIQNGLNVNDGVRSCFVTFPNYVFQPPIREISTTINKRNSLSVIKTTFNDSDMIVYNTIGVAAFKTMKLSFKTGDLVSGYVVDGVFNAAFETNFACLIYGFDGTNYWYYLNSIWNNNGATIPDSNKSFIFLTITRFNGIPEDYKGDFEFLTHSSFLQSLTVHVWGRDHVYAPIVRYPSYDPKDRKGYWKFSQIEFTPFTGSLSLTESYNFNNENKSPAYNDEKKYTNTILSGNEKFTNNPEYRNIYHSGTEHDIYGLLTYDGATWVRNPELLQIGFVDKHKFELLPLIMSANIYEKTVTTIEGDLHTNGAIHPIHSIQIDEGKWAFNGGTFKVKEESIDGQWVKVIKSTIKTGNGGVVIRGRGTTGLGDRIQDVAFGLGKVRAQFGDLLGQFLVRVLEEQGDTANPVTDTTQVLKLDFDSTLNKYGFKFEEQASPALPFDVTASPLTLETGLTGDFTLTGNYFREDSVVTISSGTLNTVTVNSMTEMVLNITASAIGESVDVTIDGVVFAGLFSYIEVVVVYVPGDGTTNWTDTLEVTTGNGTIRPASSTAWGGSGAGASAVAAAGKDVVFSCKVNQFSFSNVACMIGLDATNPNRNYNTIDYALFFLNTSNLGVYENGSNKGTSLETFTHGDTFQIRRIGTTVSYHKNGSLTPFYTSLTASIGTLGIDSAFSGTPRVEFIECSIEF